VAVVATISFVPLKDSKTVLFSTTIGDGPVMETPLRSRETDASDIAMKFRDVDPTTETFVAFIAPPQTTNELRTVKLNVLRLQETSIWPLPIGPQF
jgi:hypothetical protein